MSGRILPDPVRAWAVSGRILPDPVRAWGVLVGPCVSVASFLDGGEEDWERDEWGASTGFIMGTSSACTLARVVRDYLDCCVDPDWLATYDRERAEALLLAHLERSLGIERREPKEGERCPMCGSAVRQSGWKDSRCVPYHGLVQCSTCAWDESDGTAVS